MIKKAFKIIGILLLVIVAAAIAIPYFFKDQIVEAVKEDINKNFNAKVDFADVNLSLFSNFPDFSFDLQELSITGIDQFEGYSLLKAEDINFTLDLMSVINSDSPIEIKSINLVKPEINVKVLRDGKANYDIVKPVETSTEEAAGDYNFVVQLNEYAITDGQLVYDDRLGDVYFEIKDLNHSGEGSFTQDIFDLETQTQFASMTAKSGGVAYLNRAKGNIDLILNADVPNSKYTLKENQINLNALTLNAEGFVQLVEDVVTIDLKYDAPKNNFKNFLSMIPSAYTADYSDVQANGNLQFNGSVKGDYNMTSGALPAFKVNLKVDNGDFKYPDLPLGINNINTAVAINSPSSNLDKMVIDVSNFKMELGSNPFEATFKLWNPISDPSVDTKINGTINLEELFKAFPMQGVKELNGIISSNLVAKTSMSAIDKQEYESIDMSGDLRIENMDYTAEDLPKVKINDLQMEFTPKNVKLDKFDAVLGRSDIQAQGTVDNILAFFSPEKTMTGDIYMRSQLFDANEWVTETSPAENEPVAEIDATAAEYEVFDRFDFKMDGEVGKLFYDIYELRDTRLKGQVTPNRADIAEFRTRIGESDFKGSGNFTNIFNYVYENEVLGGEIDLVSNYININEFMVEVPADEPQAKPINETVSDELGPVLIPENIDIDINADIKKALYTNIDVKNIKGKMEIKEETLHFQDANANMLGGSVTMNGSYNTLERTKPVYDMDFKVNSFNFQNAFDKLNTFATLAPIGKFINGEFNTNLKMNGTLGLDMYPDLNTISMDGFFETLNGTLKNFEPLEKFGSKLNLDFLKSVDLKNTKNWFTMNEGKLVVQEFDYSTNGIDMKIGGSHGIDLDMAYAIKAKIPRKILQSNSVGQAADKGLKFLQGQASKLGIDIAQGEFINVSALLSGTITDPKVKVNLLGADGEAQTIDDLVDNIKDQAVDKASDLIEEKTGVDVQNIKEEVADAKEDLSAKADAEIKALQQKTEANIKKLMDEANKRADQVKKEALKLSETTKVEGYKNADKLIEEAGSNFIKKKAAEVAAKKLKQETDKKAEQVIKKGDDTAADIISKANTNADKLRAESNKQAEAIRKKYE